MNKMNNTNAAKANTKKYVDFLFETGQLKRVKRSGWWLININNPENVAEHSHRAAVVGYILAHLEEADVNKVVQMCLFNDLHEARINDLHKVGQRYIKFKEAETKAHRAQTWPLGRMGRHLFKLHEEFQKQKTKEAVVAMDSDLLENALQAKEYIDAGYKDAQNWIDNIKKVIRTKHGKELLLLIEKTSSNDWWRNLKKITR